MVILGTRKRHLGEVELGAWFIPAHPEQNSSDIVDLSSLVALIMP